MSLLYLASQGIYKIIFIAFKLTFNKLNQGTLTEGKG